MSIHLPSSIRAAVADPKAATTSALESAVSFYGDDIEGEAFDLVTEEFIRRGGDPDYAGTMEAPSFEDYL